MPQLYVVSKEMSPVNDMHIKSLEFVIVNLIWKKGLKGSIVK